MAEKEPGIHENHRQRMRERFQQQGFEGFAEHEALEYLLYFAIRRGDVNPLAHRLIARFGSFNGVLQASEEELIQVDGVGPATARLLTAVMEAAKFYQRKSVKMPNAFTSLDEIAEFVRPQFFGARNEMVFALYLDDRNCLLRLEKLAEGSVNETTFSKRELVRQVVRLGATQLVLAHNHPRGVALPSPEDMQFTLELTNMLRQVGVRFLDHIIVDGEGEATSMRQSKRAQYLTQD